MDNKCLDIVDYLDSLYPDAKCELNFSNDLELLIAVVLSAQTTDKSVNKLTINLFKKYQSLDDYINVDIKELEQDIKSIGLYHNKAKNINKLAYIIKNKYYNKIPNTIKELKTLPGVGQKTANVVISNAYNIPAIAVDTHVERVSKRLKLAYKKDSVIIVERKLMNKFNKDLWIKLHHQLVLFGRYICIARKPKCSECELKKHCSYYKFANK